MKRYVESKELPIPSFDDWYGALSSLLEKTSLTRLELGGVTKNHLATMHIPDTVTELSVNGDCTSIACLHQKRNLKSLRIWINLSSIDELFGLSFLEQIYLEPSCLPPLLPSVQALDEFQNLELNQDAFHQLLSELKVYTDIKEQGVGPLVQEHTLSMGYNSLIKDLKAFKVQKSMN